MKKYVFIMCLMLCLTGCTTQVNLNTPEQTQEQTISEYITQEKITEDCTTQENVIQENTTQDNTTSVVETTTWEDTTTENNTETPSFSEADNIMHKVLLNEAMFMDIDSGQMMYAEDLEGFTNPKVSSTHFTSGLSKINPIISNNINYFLQLITFILHNITNF